MDKEKQFRCSVQRVETLLRSIGCLMAAQQRKTESGFCSSSGNDSGKQIPFF
ncbi:hypothetical protein ATPR_1115 [Acetobacter tropicalis NBRC 101654]|uniref:Uncharacterized protein n=1 Tax=Acetobacter tropicalis NBRC 101654 TaxID=749388 RepID=F7VCL6_9PROT|nr:hypothetical protein ATPR_1115 [Acetobacter tropicalis NBRC 101654]